MHIEKKRHRNNKNIFTNLFNNNWNVIRQPFIKISKINIKQNEINKMFILFVAVYVEFDFGILGASCDDHIAIINDIKHYVGLDRKGVFTVKIRRNQTYNFVIS